jgi:lauroyl/myristoyl acyltransferase
VQAAHYLRADELVATFLDPPTLPGETRIVRSSFLNGEVTLASGGIAIPKLTGSAVLMAFIRRAPDWRHQILEVSPASLEGDEKAAFERCLASVEKTIRSDPGQWLYWKKSALTELGLLG